MHGDHPGWSVCGGRNKVQTLRKTQEDAEAEDFRACAEHFVRCGAVLLVDIITARRLMLHSCIRSSQRRECHVISSYQSVSSFFHATYCDVGDDRCGWSEADFEGSTVEGADAHLDVLLTRVAAAEGGSAAAELAKCACHVIKAAMTLAP